VVHGYIDPTIIDSTCACDVGQREAEAALESGREIVQKIAHVGFHQPGCMSAFVSEKRLAFYRSFYRSFEGVLRDEESRSLGV